MCEIATKTDWKAGDQVKVVHARLGELAAEVREMVGPELMRVWVPELNRTMLIPPKYVSEAA